MVLVILIILAVAAKLYISHERHFKEQQAMSAENPDKPADSKNGAE